MLRVLSARTQPATVEFVNPKLLYLRDTRPTVSGNCSDLTVLFINSNKCQALTVVSPCRSGVVAVEPIFQPIDVLN